MPSSPLSCYAARAGFERRALSNDDDDDVRTYVRLWLFQTLSIFAHVRPWSALLACRCACRPWRCALEPGLAHCVRRQLERSGVLPVPCLEEEASRGEDAVVAAVRARSQVLASLRRRLLVVGREHVTRARLALCSPSFVDATAFIVIVNATARPINCRWVDARGEPLDRAETDVVPAASAPHPATSPCPT